MKSEDSTTSAAPSSKIKIHKGGRDFFRATLLCILAVIFVRTLLVEPFKIPSSSMQPTLRIGDYIFVSKYNYGWFVPFTNFEFVKWGAPQRGDAVVFLFPKDPSLHYVKRIIGLPGDKIELVGTQLSINGEKVQDEPITDAETIAKVTGSPEYEGSLFKETLGTHSFYVAYSRSARQKNEFGKFELNEIPPDSYFMMGDNRDDSYDSRAWGIVTREHIRGKAQYIWMSLDNHLEPGSKNTGPKSLVRWDRVFTAIP